MTAMAAPIRDDKLRIVPANGASWEDIQADFGTTRPVPVPEPQDPPTPPLSDFETVDPGSVLQADAAGRLTVFADVVESVLERRIRHQGVDIVDDRFELFAPPPSERRRLAAGSTCGNARPLPP